MTSNIVWRFFLERASRSTSENYLWKGVCHLFMEMQIFLRQLSNMYLVLHVVTTIQK